MEIKIYSLNNKYAFLVVDNSSNKIIFSSVKKYFLVPFIQSNYKYAWEAHRDAERLINQKSYHLNTKCAREDLSKPVIVDISAEEMLKNQSDPDDGMRPIKRLRKEK